MALEVHADVCVCVCALSLRAGAGYVSRMVMARPRCGEENRRKRARGVPALRSEEEAKQRKRLNFRLHAGTFQSARNNGNLIVQINLENALT